MVEVIAQRYRIESELGQGGMGTVYKGLDTHTQQTIAIKHLKPELTAPELIERFKREGEALRELNHPNIVKMLDAVEEDGNHYLIIEYLAGGDLADLLKQGELPLEKVLHTAIDICDALTRAHRLHIIHRDLKPANILIAADGTPRLTDFGIAHFAGKKRVTASDAIVGTVDYLAPEILDGEMADPRADIWAFGVMLFEMLAGQRPFRGQSIAQTLMAIVTQPTPDLEELSPDTPVALVDLTYRMLEKDRHARIASVRHVGAALEDILQGRDTNNVQPVQATRFETPIPDFLQRPKHNLPAQTTPFVGRESELGELARLIENPNTRLVSILAPGGMGKTRLALELAERQLARFEHGVYVVELAPLNAVEQIVPAIANALNFQFQSDGRETKQQLIDFLQNKQLLLVMDNYEHLVAGASLVTDLLKAVSSLKILVTSRERLDQQGETLFHLSGMDFPTWETPEDALNYAAVKLFMNSARLAQPGFELTESNLDSVARICRLVAGMPLGILLAASWLGMLTPQEIAAELQKNLDFLESDSQQIPSRQRSIRVVMDYSWQQMSLPEQQVFRKLSVFQGGFTRDAAESVAESNLRILMSLCNKSLLRRDTESGRYEIHELLRQYAEEKLEAEGVAASTRRSHSHYFAEWVAAHEHSLMSALALDTISHFDKDFANIEAGWHWALTQQDHEVISRMMSTLTVFFTISERLWDATQFFKNVIEQTEHESVKARLMLRYALFDMRGYSYQIPQTTLEQYFASANPIEDPFEKAFALYTKGLYEALIKDQVELAISRLSEVIKLFETLHQRWWLAQTYTILGFVQAIAGKETVTVLKSTQTAHDIFLEIGAKFCALGLHNNLARTYFEMGETETALKLIEELNQERHKLNWKGSGMMQSLANEGGLWEHLGAYEESLVLYQEAVELAIYHNNLSSLVDVYPSIAGVFAKMKRYDEAQIWLEKSEVLFSTLNDKILISVFYSYKGFIDYLRSAYETGLVHCLNAYQLIQDTEISRLKGIYQLEIGLCQVKLGNVEEASEALHQSMNKSFYSNQLVALYGFAELAYKQGDFMRSGELASSLIDAKAMEELYKSYTKDLLVSLKDVMPEDEYNQAMERGKNLDLKAVIQEIVEEFNASKDE